MRARKSVTYLAAIAAVLVSATTVVVCWDDWMVSYHLYRYRTDANYFTSALDRQTSISAHRALLRFLGTSEGAARFLRELLPEDHIQVEGSPLSYYSTPVADDPLTLIDLGYHLTSFRPTGSYNYGRRDWEERGPRSRRLMSQLGDALYNGAFALTEHADLVFEFLPKEAALKRLESWCSLFNPESFFNSETLFDVVLLLTYCGERSYFPRRAPCP